jgi:hypothetical protein
MMPAMVIANGIVVDESARKERAAKRTEKLSRIFCVRPADKKN